MIGWMDRVMLRAVILSLLISVVASAETIQVSAAISLRGVLETIAKNYEKETGERVELRFGSSGQIMTQIKGGAPVDVFISAADRQVDELVEAGLVDAQSVRVVAGNELVLIVPADAKDHPRDFTELVTDKVTRLAMGEPRTVPAGMYAEQTLRHFKIEDALQKRIVYGTNVRQVLDYVIRGEVSAGLVYATDAGEAGDKVKVVATAPADAHEPIHYPAAIIKGSTQGVASGRFLDYLAEPSSLEALKRFGFSAPAEKPAATQPDAQPETQPGERESRLPNPSHQSDAVVLREASSGLVTRFEFLYS